MSPTRTAAEVLGRALTETEADGDATGDAILDAALQIAAASGLKGVTMDAVAARAGVGRMTVYRRFESKERLLTELTVREARRGFAEIVAAVDPDADPADQIADGFVASLRVARESPIAERLIRHEPDRLLRSLNDPADPLFEMLRNFVAAQIGGERAEVVAELFVRIGLSFLLIRPSAIEIDDEAVARDLARTMFAPLRQAAA